VKRVKRITDFASARLAIKNSMLLETRKNMGCEITIADSAAISKSSDESVFLM
jgi:hypothetical protein